MPEDETDWQVYDPEVHALGLPRGFFVYVIRQNPTRSQAWASDWYDEQWGEEDASAKAGIRLESAVRSCYSCRSIRLSCERWTVCSEPLNEPLDED